MDNVKPFNQALSDAKQPIKVVIDKNGNKHVMNGNHRIQGAAEDGIPNERIKVSSTVLNAWFEAR